MPDKYIYVIGPEGGPYKIGYSGNPEKRLRQLQTGHPCRLMLGHACAVDSDKAMLLEQLIHRNNRHHTITGEWFNLTLEEAIAEVEFAMIRYTD